MQAKNYPIKDWAKEDQPREKLLRKGPETLSDSELLAIIVNQGTRGLSAIDVGKALMKRANNDVNQLYKLTIKELSVVPGIGPAKAIILMAALELGRRRYAAELKESMEFHHSRQAAAYFRTLLRDHRREVFGVMYLNRANRFLRFEIVSEGGIASAMVEPRRIIRLALEHEASHLLLCHNHPSGQVKPSTADKQLTQKIQEAAKIFDVSVLDHIIVGEEGYYSFADEGIL